MKLVQFIGEYAVFLLGLFAVGCAISLVREFRKVFSAQAQRRLKLLEWCLLPPGFAAIFVTLQQHSVRYFALHPAWTVATFLGIAAASALLMLAQRKKPRPFLTWLSGLLGVPGLVFPLVLLGLYFQSPRQFEAIRATYIQLAATEGKLAPDFRFTLLGNREERKLMDYRGCVVLVNIWATWCTPCLSEMPDLDRLQQKYRRRGLVVINLSDEPIEVIATYLSKHPMATTHGRVDRQDVPEFYQFGGVRPTSFLIGKQGEVIASIIGAKDLDYFERTILPSL